MLVTSQNQRFTDFCTILLAVFVIKNQYLHKETKSQSLHRFLFLYVCKNSRAFWPWSYLQVDNVFRVRNFFIILLFMFSNLLLPRTEIFCILMVDCSNHLFGITKRATLDIGYKLSYRKKNTRFLLL